MTSMVLEIKVLALVLALVRWTAWMGDGDGGGSVAPGLLRVRSRTTAGALGVVPLLLLVGGDGVGDLVVHNKHESGTSATQDVGKGTLKEAARALILEDLGEAIGHALVHLLGGRLGGLDLETTLHGAGRV